MHDCIWGLEADGTEAEKGRSILCCSARRLLCLLSGSGASFLVAIYCDNPGGCKDGGTPVRDLHQCQQRPSPKNLSEYFASGLEEENPVGKGKTSNSNNVMKMEKH